MNFYLASLKNMKDEKPKAIRLNIVLRSTDIGFEFIYQELSKLNDQASRSKFIKMFLHDACVGVPLKASTQKITNLDKRGSFSFGLRLSPNEIGFEKLYKELIAVVHKRLIAHGGN